MSNSKLAETLSKIPVGLLVAIYGGYLAYDYYTFTNSQDSPLLMKQAEIESTKKENQALQAKIKAANDFLRSLDQKKAELRRLTQDLQDLKGTLSTEQDIASFMKMVVIEAKKVGLTVESIKPEPVVKKEYYEEQPYNLAFHGVYVQLLVFLDRLANFQNIVRADDFELHPDGAATSKYVEIGGTVKIKTFKYLGSKADEINTPESQPGGAVNGGKGPAGAKPDGKKGGAGP